EATPILWDAKTGVRMRRFPGHTERVTSVAFLPDGRRAASGSADGTIRIWDVETAGELLCLRDTRTGCLACSPDGRRLVASSGDPPELVVWDYSAQKLVQQINWGNANPTAGCYTPDGRFVVWGGWDGAVRIYRVTGSGG